MTSKLILLALPLALGMAGCNKSPGAPGDAQKTADALSSGAAGKAGTSPACKLFTADEIAAYEGAPVAAGINAAGGSGCQWMDQDGEGYALLQIVPEDYYETSSSSPGYKELPDVGKKAFVVPEDKGWGGGVIKGSQGIMFSTRGTSTEAMAVMFLKEAMKRTPG